jgi:hypothetical protein
VKTARARIVVAASSVAIIAAVNLLAAASGPPALELWLRIIAVVATAAAVQSAAWDRTDLLLALLLSMPALAALTAETSPTWLIGPLSALLLVAAELNALSWQLQGPEPLDAARRRTLLRIGVLGVLALGAAAIVTAAGALPVPPGMAAVMLAAAAFALLGARLLDRPSRFPH